MAEIPGIDDPYERPLYPEIRLDTVSHSPEENARLILDYLVRQGFVRRDEGQGESVIEPVREIVPR